MKTIKGFRASAVFMAIIAALLILNITAVMAGAEEVRSDRAERVYESSAELIEQDGIFYEESSDGTLSVKSADKNITQAVIPETVNGKKVTFIGKSAFIRCSSLTFVTIPESVTTIGDLAFSSCYHLASVIIPDSVTTIGSEVFTSCYDLTQITIPSSVTYIGYGVFDGCAHLQDIYYTGTEEQCENMLKQSEWNGYVLDNNVSRSVTFHYNSPPAIITGWEEEEEQSAEVVGSNEFGAGYKLDGVNYFDNYLLGSVTVTGADKNITTAVIRESFNGKAVTHIVDWAFSSCSELSSITLPNSIRYIGLSSFMYCNKLTSITIPDSVRSIDTAAFHYCSNLENIYYTGTQQQWIQLLRDSNWDGKVHDYGGEFTPTVHCNSSGPDAESFVPADSDVTSSISSSSSSSPTPVDNSKTENIDNNYKSDDNTDPSSDNSASNEGMSVVTIVIAVAAVMVTIVIAAAVVVVVVVLKKRDR